MSVLFLWNCDYLTERLVLPGGMAQYLGECIAQFFINPVKGALAYTILFILAQKLSSKLLRQFFPNIKDKVRFLLSLIPPIVLWYVAMLPHIPLTPTIAALLVMTAGCALMTIQSKRIRFIALCLLIPVMYWLTGPMAVLLDDQGKATKPFLLPQRNPKQYYRRLLYSYNTPDFTSRALDFDARDMGRRIESDERVSTK